MMAASDSLDRARGWLDQGWLVSTVFDARQGVGAHYSARGVTVLFCLLQSDEHVLPGPSADTRRVTLAGDDLAVLADYACSIGHASAGYLAWQVLALAGCGEAAAS